MSDASLSSFNYATLSRKNLKLLVGFISLSLSLSPCLRLDELNKRREIFGLYEVHKYSQLINSVKIDSELYGFINVG